MCGNLDASWAYDMLHVIIAVGKNLAFLSVSATSARCRNRNVCCTCCRFFDTVFKNISLLPRQTCANCWFTVSQITFMGL